MRKIEGLKFLQMFFWNLCVDCIFVGYSETFNEQLIECCESKIFRVRSGRRFGSELNCPQKTCRTIKEVKRFIDKMRTSDDSLEFVIHRVNESYFKPNFVGTIAIFEEPRTEMVIEFQAVSKELVAKIDTGVRPRDWKVAATYVYPFLSSLVEVHIFDRSFNAEALKSVIFQLWGVGKKIDAIKQSLDNNMHETVTRFNIYPSGAVLLDDHRSVSSFTGNSRK